MKKSRTRIRKFVYLALIFNLSFLIFNCFPLSQASANWGIMPPIAYRWDSVYNLNGLIEINYLLMAPTQFGEDSIEMSWTANFFNPYSLLRNSWDDVYGSGSWTARQQGWNTLGTYRYDLEGNSNWSMPFNLNRFNIFKVPVSGLNLSLDGFQAQSAINISGTTYTISDKIIFYELKTFVLNPLPNLHTFEESITIEKFTGLMVSSKSIYHGTGALGWEYTLTIESVLSIWIPVLIGVIILIGICAIAFYLFYGRFFKKQEEIE